MDKDQLDTAFESFKELADKKREVNDKDLEALMSDQRQVVKETLVYKLDHVQVSCGNHDIATATVRLIDRDGKIITDASTGTGPVDAVYKAINRIVQVSNVLSEFNIQAVTEGIDAMGQVTIRVEKDSKSYVGRGGDTDIIVASAKAYMNALNRLLAMQEAGKETTSISK